MLLEIYNMDVSSSHLMITLEAVCDVFSSLLWDVRYYECGQFEIYVSANYQNTAIFQLGKIVGRSDDKKHYGIIEKVTLETDTENGDYLIVSGRFLTSLLSRRIIYPTLSFSTLTSYGEIVQQAVDKNCINPGRNQEQRILPGLRIGNIAGDCWLSKTRLQVSYDNLMEWIYAICELTGGTANIRLQETDIDSRFYVMVFELSQGADRSILQDSNAHIVFSDLYDNLIDYSDYTDCSCISNFAYIFGEGEGKERKHTIYFDGYIRSVSTADDVPAGLERYETYVDARDISSVVQDEQGEIIPISVNDYYDLLSERGAENLMPMSETAEFTVVADGRQHIYNKDYFTGDYVTVQNTKFGLVSPKIQLIGMIESYDQNGRNLTPTFRI